MFEFLFSNNKVKNLSKVIKDSNKSSDKIVPLFWTEHCVECSAPKCYETCPHYKKRCDGHCVRVVNGITPTEVNGKLGAVVEFRKWAKIESQLKLEAIQRTTYIKSYIWFSKLGYAIELLARICPISKISRFLHDGWFSYRQKYINHLVRNEKQEEALTLVGAVINNDHPTKLLVDIKTSSQLIFREAIGVPIGETNMMVAIPPVSIKSDICYINFHPANPDEHVTLCFSETALVPTDKTLGKKVKCVIWDLDNTLWDGVLVEKESVNPRAEFVELIKQLDAKGIVNSIASKNNEEQVTPILGKAGISDLFVFKKINWEPKSVNIGRTIHQMNINPNTVVFIDDNPFERSEVATSQPKVTCIDPSEIIDFSKCERFNMVVTEDSRNRRKTYKMMEAMQDEEEKWDGSIDDFLKSCEIKVELSKPNDNNIKRCYELLQRTNQLNSSGRRLSLDEVEAIVKSTSFDSYVLKSSDRFGDYGIVGFLIVEKQDNGAHVTDFVISCRVANKKIEPTLINYLASKYNGTLFFHYKKTSLNGPMFKIIEELGMKLVDDSEQNQLYQHKYSPEYPKIVSINCLV